MFSIFFCLRSGLIQQHSKNIGIYIEKEVVQEGSAGKMIDAAYYVKFTVTILKYIRWGFETDKISKIDLPILAQINLLLLGLEKKKREFY